MKSEAEQSDRPRARLRIGLGAGVVLVLVFAGIGVLVSALTPHGSPAAAAEPRTVHTAAPESSPLSDSFVHVAGEVVNPGVYQLPAGSRVVDAVAAAGGFAPAADQSGLNLAQVVDDGQQIIVAAQGVAPVAGAAASTGAAGSPTVDINQADATALETLDGIGPALAQRIVAYRSAHGRFRSVRDLQNVTGIGPKKFAAIKASVTT